MSDAGPQITEKNFTQLPKDVPKEFKMFLLKFNGGFLIMEGPELKGINFNSKLKILNFNSFYGLNHKNDFRDILYHISINTNFLPEGMLPIGSLDSLIVISLRENDYGRVYNLDNDTGEFAEDELYLLANSFVEFLDISIDSYIINNQLKEKRKERAEEVNQKKINKTLDETNMLMKKEVKSTMNLLDLLSKFNINNYLSNIGQPLIEENLYELPAGKMLPEDFKIFLLKINGGYFTIKSPIFKYIDIEGHSGNIEMNKFLYFKSTEGNSILELSEKYLNEKDIPEGIFPFMKNNYDNRYMCISNRRFDNGVVYYIDLDSKQYAEDSLCFVANNFTEFLKMLIDYCVQPISN